MEFEQAWPYVIAVYIGIWLILVIYLVILGSKVAGLRKELGVVKQALEEKSSQTKE